MNNKIILRAFPGATWARLIKRRPGQKRPFHMRLLLDREAWCGATDLRNMAEVRDEVDWHEACQRCREGYIAMACDADLQAKIRGGTKKSTRYDTSRAAGRAKIRKEMG